VLPVCFLRTIRGSFHVDRLFGPRSCGNWIHLWESFVGSYFARLSCASHPLGHIHFSCGSLVGSFFVTCFVHSLGYSFMGVVRGSLWSTGLMYLEDQYSFCTAVLSIREPILARGAGTGYFFC
jgi:hypothetical protein